MSVSKTARKGPRKPQEREKPRGRALAAKKGWIARKARQEAEFKRRSEAAKKGWRKRKAQPTTYLVETGYSGRENSFRMKILIRPRKRLSLEAVGQLVEKLLRQGHFDDSDENPVADLQWTASLLNVTEVEVSEEKLEPQHAVLFSFDRQVPGGLD
jgi:hypothetical protein